MARYELTSGKHQHDDGRTYAKGDVIETDHRLDLLFRGKFKRLPVVAPSATPGSPPPSGKEAGKGEETKRAPELSGEDVTVDFPASAARGFSVRRKGAWYHVYDGEDPTPVNDKALRAADVDDFTARYLEE